MATRKKSRTDLINQYNRIAELREYLANRDGSNAARGITNVQEYVDAYNRGAARANARDDKAFEITKRYVENIQNKKSYQRTRARAAKNPDMRDELRNKANNRKYSQRSYMGGNAG